MNHSVKEQAAIKSRKLIASMTSDFSRAESTPIPTDRGKRGTKCSLLVKQQGLPLGVVVSGVNTPDSKLLETTLLSIRPVGTIRQFAWLLPPGEFSFSETPPARTDPGQRAARRDAGGGTRPCLEDRGAYFKIQSTVSVLDKFRGKSGSKPRITLM